MRVGRSAVVVAVLVAGACSTGDGGDFGIRETTSTSAVPAPSTTTTAAPAPSTTTTVAVAGSVTFRVTGLTLPDVRAGGTGLRVLVRLSSERLTVRRRGGEGSVSACPVALPIPSPNDGPCVDLAAGGAVELPFIAGVELRATAATAALDEVTVTYVPVSRAVTLVTPSRPAGACQATACETTFALVPGGAGTFRLTGQAAGGRPRLVLTSVGAGVSNRTLATVEGGGSLSITATLDAGSEARLLHHEQGPGPVTPVTAEILWP
ncbi:MAG: hypothetical protein ABR540_04765 [Acidimicrobiales bacterium]